MEMMVMMALVMSSCVRYHSGDSLELDDGADLRDSLESGTNMVIQVSYDGHDDVQDGDECPIYHHGDPA